MEKTNYNTIKDISSNLKSKQSLKYVVKLLKLRLKLTVIK